MKIARLSISSTASGTSFDGFLPPHGEGFAVVIKVKIAQCVGVPTATLNIYDRDGDLVYLKAAIPENTVTMIYALSEAKDIPIMAGAKVNLTFTADPGIANHDLTFYIE